MTEREREWTDQSVLEFASGSDPILKMEQEAQKVILHALDHGWRGPPFDPVELANILKILVKPNAALADARVFWADGQYEIEYNPHRPLGRVNFSVAHEIAHTFFPDCSEKIRNRTRANLDPSNWQIELLCNIGAAELLMPVGSFPSDSSVETIEDLMRLRKEYRVSAEAILIRFAKLSSSKITSFATSRRTKTDFSHEYRLEYSVPSKNWNKPAISSDLFRFHSKVLDDCVAIGTTSKGAERWKPNSPKLHIEAVALPPLPGLENLRVVGFVRPVLEETRLSNINYRHGNAARFVTDCSVAILHVVNDRALRWGARGFAAALREEHPDAYDEYVQWGQQSPSEKRLGNVHIADLLENRYVVSLIAQEGYGSSRSPRIRYHALNQSLQIAADYLLETGVEIVQMPPIGTGQAGGNWSVIEGMVRETLVSAGFEVRVIELPP